MSIDREPRSGPADPRQEHTGRRPTPSSVTASDLAEARRDEAPKKDPSDLERLPESWSWNLLGPSGEVLEADTWEEAFAAIDHFASSEEATQLEVLRKYQSLLDRGDLPREVEANVRLRMGAHLIAQYNAAKGEESRDEEAIRWYRDLLTRFNGWENHSSVMRARIHLGNLYDRNNTGGPAASKSLYQRVLDVPAEEIVFDHPEKQRFNVNHIEAAKAPRAGRAAAFLSPEQSEFWDQRDQEHQRDLWGQRMYEIDWIRQGAAKSLAYLYIEPGLGFVTRERLQGLKDSRPDDPVFQQAVQKVYDWYDEVNSKRQTPNWDSLEEDRVIATFQ